ncbi:MULTISPECIES: hypothetical protein [unclassified Butyricimonas]|uniref:hypothetical protein n=1 Tax=unclassified Butyricimonas TaxID=2637652 RepID=UPI000C072DB8|nr:MULTISPECIES: hypothetical protein [unclassified Butyricimonas]
MRKSIVVLFLLIVGSVFASNRRSMKVDGCEYVVLASRSVEQDKAWNGVVEALQRLHGAEVVYYAEKPAETLEALRRMRPRYVAVVEKPEQITRDYIIGMHILSRKVTSSIYADFMWGIITGLDADMAMKMVNNAKEPLEIRNGLISQNRVELTEADWERFGYVSWGKSGMKMERGDTLAMEYWPAVKQVEKFNDLYRRVKPDFVLSESYAPNYHLSMPDNFSVHERIYARDGIFHHVMQEVKIEDNQISRQDTSDNEMNWAGERKVYIAAGSYGCDVDKPEKSCALAWMGRPNVTSMVGYPVNQVMLGQAVWGGLKFWHVTPGRYTMAEAYFLGQQHILYTLQNFSPSLLEASFDFNWDVMNDISGIYERMAKVMGKEAVGDILGFWQERDLLAYFGDPKWDVRFRPEEETYTVKTVRKGKKYVITLKTKENFSVDRLDGIYMRMFDNQIPGEPATVGKIPFAVIFPERLKNPRLAPEQDWRVALSDDMLLVYDTWFEPGKTYKLVLSVD